MWEYRKSCRRAEGRLFRLPFSLGVGVTQSGFRPQVGGTGHSA